MIWGVGPEEIEKKKIQMLFSGKIELFRGTLQEKNKF